MSTEVREEQDKGMSRRLRTANESPAIIYGGKEMSLAAELGHDKVMDIQVKAKFYSEALTIVVDSKEIKVRAQDIQRHPYKPKLLHIDSVHV